MEAQAAQHFEGNHIAEGEWSTGFWDCFSDCKNCCITCWCPCITFSQIAKIIDRGSTSLSKVGAFYTCISTVTGCGCIYSYFYRGKMRAQYNLRGSDFGDFCRHFLCEVCALTQEYRELKNRGFDMTLGWEENMERQQNRGVAMGAPVVQNGMTRH